MATKKAKKATKMAPREDVPFGEITRRGGKPATIFPPLDPAKIQLAAIRALTEFAQNPDRSRDFWARNIDSGQLPVNYSFALHVQQGFGVVGLMETHLAEHNDVLAALVKLAAGDTSPEWNREHVVKGG